MEILLLVAVVLASLATAVATAAGILSLFFHLLTRLRPR